MYFGLLAKPFTVLGIAIALSGTLTVQTLRAQMMDEQTAPRAWRDSGPQQSGPMQALFMSAAPRMFGATQTPYMDANGNPVVVPAGYASQCPGGCPSYAGPMQYGDAPCDGAPCDGCYGGPECYGGPGGYGEGGYGSG